MTKKLGGKEKHPSPITKKRNKRSLDTKHVTAGESPAEYERRASILESLLQAGQAITASVNSEQVLFLIVQSAAELLSADVVVIYPYDSVTCEFMLDRVVIGSKSKAETLRQASPSDFATKAVQQGIIIVDDVSNTKDYLSSEDVGGSFIERENIKAFASVALRVGDEPVGVLYVNFRTPHLFAEEEREIIQLFAAQAAIAIQNARFSDKTIGQLQALREVDRALSATLDLDRALNLILDKAIELTSAHAGYIHMYDARTAELVTRASRGADEERQRRRIRPGEGITGWVAQHGQSMIVPDVTQDARYLSIIPGMMSELAVPLVSGGELIGVLNVESPHLDAFSSDDVRLLEALASQSVIAIRVATLFTKTQKRARELEVLLDVHLAITSTLDLGGVLNRILDTTLAMTQAHAGYIHLHDSASNELVTRASRGITSERQSFRVKMGEGVTGLVAQRAEAILVSDVTQDPWKNIYLGVIPNTRSELAVPLLRGGVLMGVLNIESPIVNAFTQDDMKLVEILASSAVIAIQNAAQYEALQETHQELKLSLKKQMAAEAMASLGTVTSTLLHRIGNTIGPIPVLVDEVKESIEPKNAETTTWLEEIRKNAEETLKLTQQLRIAVRSKSSPNKPLEPQVILKSALATVSVPTDIMVHVDCLPDLPKVMGSEQLFDAFGNLIQNSIQASHAGGKVILTAKTAADDIEFTVSDEGMGIPAEYLERVFDLFFTTKSGGLGFGLWLTRKIVEEHGGTIALESTLGKGTTVTVRLPTWKNQTREVAS